LRKPLLMIVAMGLTAIALLWGAPARAANEIEVEAAKHLIELIKIGRVIVSEQMANINDASKSYKKFTGDYMAGQVMDRFRKSTNLDLRVPDDVPYADLYLSLIKTEKDVVDEAQPIINRPGIGFKGFTPSVFARRVSDRLYMEFGVRMRLTTIDYRNTNAKPDDFEAEVLRMFSDSRRPKGQPYVRNFVTMEGRPVLRVMDPEYAGPTCLACHGGLKGELNVTGMKKEGWKEGDLAGAISIVLPLKAVQTEVQKTRGQATLSKERTR
jgi:Protein of unknown function (DUF3365)